jgi:xanthine dehydrogenase YagS FAD-binding subunit
MRPFIYHRATSDSAALQTVIGGAAPRDQPPTSARAQFIAGGTTMLDLMKLDVMRPSEVIDINRIAGLDQVEKTPDGLRLGALARMADVARHPLLADYPVIAQSLTLAASPQLRNMATLGGNVLQRTRCTYFRDPSWKACNKRDPGSGCAALDGFNRSHAVLGVSDHCIATYPGDFAQALIALDALVEIRRQGGERVLAFADLHRKPGDRPDIETALAPDELIAAFRVPAAPWTRRSLYLKIRDRQSYEFALASAAVALDLAGDGAVRQARIALGGVATVPWRAREAEAALVGHKVADDVAQRAAEIAFRDAQPRRRNAFKVELGRRALQRALLETASLEI